MGLLYKDAVHNDKEIDAEVPSSFLFGKHLHACVPDGPFLIFDTAEKNE